MKLFLIGGGSFAQWAAGIAEAAGQYEAIEFLYDRDHSGEGLDSCENFVLYMEDDTDFYPAFADNHLRVEWFHRLKAFGCGIASLIHPDSRISSNVQIIRGTLIAQGCMIEDGCVLKSGTILFDHSVIGKNCVTGEGASLGSGAYLPAGTLLQSCERFLSRKETAMNLFTAGYNCAQSIALAFADRTPLSKETMGRISSPFGGGMGRLREVCGAISGSLMVIGLLYGYDTPETGEPKAELYAKVQRIAAEFEKKNQSMICRELLGRERETPVPEARTKAYYDSRPCRELIGSAAEILERYLWEHPAP